MVAINSVCVPHHGSHTAINGSKSINASLNDSKYDYKLSKYCSNEGNIYTESLGDLAYQNNPKFKKFIAYNGLGFKSYAQFGKAEITERIQLLVQLFNLVWNTEIETIFILIMSSPLHVSVSNLKN